MKKDINSLTKKQQGAIVVVAGLMELRKAGMPSELVDKIMKTYADVVGLTNDDAVEVAKCMLDESFAIFEQKIDGDVTVH